MMAKRKKSQQNENKLIYIPFVVLAVIIIILVAVPYLGHPSSSSPITANANTPLFNLYKVSNTNYASNNSVEIYFISWYGCPNGATTSWPLYLALSKYGNLSIVTHYSVNEQKFGGEIPALLFLNYTPFPNSRVYFHPIYIYGQYLNQTTNGTPINTDDVTFGLKELKSELPGWAYNLVVYYEVNQTYTKLNNTAPAYFGSHPHIITILIITGPGGTWVDLGYPNSISPTVLAALNSTLLYNMILNKVTPSGQYLQAYNEILNASSEITNAINEALA
ncbi:DUF929 domain-containing protein [Saccharolobus islandicus]|jgi:hypothetical protein|uniref:DUF929 domain-containing protein n=1 Tax=Saccharolobus islandicus (strain M.16.4 / Kamchatka \|nr:DUF929 domain-containing protein [Sulfolobus islandicus]ACR43314.1 protein of unknown function DUF929 [Sulfolobus islandicus M.16.4]